MSDADLQRLLHDLHRALEKRPELDPETERLLATLRLDLDRTLADAAARKALATDLESRIEHFESTHPELVETARRIVDQLANVGL